MRIIGVVIGLCLFFALPGGAAETVEETYTVLRGENLYLICQRLLERPSDWQKVATYNHLKNPALLQPGQEIRIPATLLRGVPVDGSVTFIKGRVEIFPENGSPRELKVGDRIQEGDSIQTGGDGVVELAYEDQSSILLRPSTTLNVIKARKKTKTQIARDFFMKIGRSLIRVNRSSSNRERLNVTTPSAVAGVRGTEFRVAVDDAKLTKTEVIQGRVNLAAMRKAVDVAAGEGTRVALGKAPEAPVKLLLPPKPKGLMPLYNQMPLQFDLQPTPGATAHRVFLARDKLRKDIVKGAILPPDDTFRVIGVEDGTYYLQASSIDNKGLEGIPSEPETIRVRVNPLPPFLNEPSSGADLRDPAVQFKWLQVGDAVSYHVQIAKDPAFKQMAAEREGIQTPGWTSDSLAFGDYYFRLRSSAADEYRGAWSEISRFQLIPPPPSPPMDPPQMDEKGIRVRWQGLGEGIRYRFQLARDENFEQIVLEEVLDQPETMFEKPKDSGTYFIRTSGIDTEGYEGSFSAPQQFEVEMEMPYAVFGYFAIIGILALLL